MVNKHIAKLTSFLEKNWVMVIAALIAVMALYQYNTGKLIFKNPFTNAGSRNFLTPTDYGEHSEDQGGIRAAAPAGQNSGPADISGIAGTQVQGGGASTQNIDPAELLPSDANSGWTGVQGNGDMGGPDILSAGHLQGINTVAGTLRNPNLQLRSEPPNPRGNTGPWLASTIETDTQRRPLEIGSTM
jgi:hypothetical protein